MRRGWVGSRRGSVAGLSSDSEGPKYGGKTSNALGLRFA